MFRRSLTVLSLALLFLASAPAPVPAAAAEGQTSFGLRFGDKLAEGYIDLLAPLASWESDLLFLNPRFALGDEGANELNIGLGWRHAFGECGLLGGNVYFDSRYTAYGNRFDQVGVGLEWLGTWFDIRGNYYWPQDDEQLASSRLVTETAVGVVRQETWLYGPWTDPAAAVDQIFQDRKAITISTTTTTTTTIRRTMENWESARRGYDAEIGFKVPLFGVAPGSQTPALRVFTGYYRFEDDFDKVVQGAKGRLEIRALPYLTIDAEVFNDRELNGSDYVFGARLHAPFSLQALFRGENPFARTAPPAGIRSRLNEMVMRDVRVQTGEGGWTENQALHQEESSDEVALTKTFFKQKYMLLDDVIFVNGDNFDDPRQDGTAEHPYDVLQEGANEVYGRKNLYVYAFGKGYREGASLLPGTTLTGQGTALIGHDSAVFGGDEYPVIYGAPRGIAPEEAVGVVLADDTSVSGVELIGQMIGIEGTDISGTISLTNNRIFGTGVGIDVSTKGDASVTIAGNTIGMADGINSLTSDRQIYFPGEGLAGIVLFNTEGNLTADISYNDVSDTIIGIGVVSGGSVMYFPTSLDLVKVADGIPPPIYEAATDLSITGNTLAGNMLGIGLANLGVSDMTADISRNRIDETLAGIAAINVDQALFLGTTIAAAAPTAYEPGSLSLTVGGNRIDASDGLLGIGVLNLGYALTTAGVSDNRVAAGVGILGVNADLPYVDYVIGSLMDSGLPPILPFRGPDSRYYVPASPAGTLDFTASGNDVFGFEGMIGIGVVNAGEAETTTVIGGDVAGNTLEGYYLAIGAGNLSPLSSGFRPIPPASDNSLTASVVGNTIVDSYAGIGIGGIGNPATTAQVSGNRITGSLDGIAVGFTGSGDFFYLPVGLEVMDLHRTADIRVFENYVRVEASGMVAAALDYAAMDIRINRNDVVSGEPIMVYSEDGSSVGAVLRSNTVSGGPMDIVGWTSGGALTMDMLGNSGPAVDFTLGLLNSSGTLSVYGLGTLGADNPDASSNPASIITLGTITNIPRP